MLVCNLVVRQQRWHTCFVITFLCHDALRALTQVHRSITVVFSALLCLQEQSSSQRQLVASHVLPYIISWQAPKCQALYFQALESWHLVAE